MDKLRLVFLYVYKHILYTYLKKTDHIAMDVGRTLCNILYGKGICTWIDIYNLQMNQIVYT